MLLALGRLIRLSLTPSAAADAAAGLVFGAAAWPEGGAPWLLLGGSLCIYHGGMALNDWADREHDARTRPERPIPSGAVPGSVALGLALALFVVGPALALGVSTGAALGLSAVAMAAALYDLVGRGALLGPFLLGLCRAGNLGTAIWVGLDLADRPFEPRLLVPALVYGLYVFTLSTLARFEDEEAGHIDPSAPPHRRPGCLVGSAGLLLAGVPLSAVLVQGGGQPFLAIGLGVVGAFGLWKLLPRDEPWRPPDVLRAMGMGLRRLLIATAGLTLASGAPEALWVAALILGGYGYSFALRRAFPPS